MAGLNYPPKVPLLYIVYIYIHTRIVVVGRDCAYTRNFAISPLENSGSCEGWSLFTLLVLITQLLGVGGCLTKLSHTSAS